MRSILPTIKAMFNPGKSNATGLLFSPRMRPAAQQQAHPRCKIASAAMVQKLIATIACLFLLAQPLSAQVFPVQLNQNLPTLPARLTDLAEDPLTNYQVSLNLVDPRESSVQVFLRMRLEGSNVLIQSRPVTVPVIHNVEFGVPLTLTGMDLGYLFAPGNLEIRGRSSQEFFRNGGNLDEGFYTLCIEAFLISNPNERGVSNESCLPLFVAIQEPPLVTYPIGDQTVPAHNPASLSFTWLDQTAIAGAVNFDLEVTPLGANNNIADNTPFGGNYNINNSGPGGNVNVNNNIVRRNIGPNISPNLNDPNSPITLGNTPNQNAPVIFKTGLTGLTYDLLPEDPQLIQGQLYTVRVRAYDPLGQRNYRNGGWSAPIVFQYGEVCLPPTNVFWTPAADVRMRGSWSGPVNARGYTVSILNTNHLRPRWYRITTTIPGILLDRLEPSSTYDYIIQSNCSGGPGAPVSGQFTTPGAPNVNNDNGNGGPNDNGDGPDNSNGDGSGTSSPTQVGTFSVSEDGEPYQPEIQACDPSQPLSAATFGMADPNQTLAANQEFKVGHFTIRTVTVTGSASSGFDGTGTALIPWLEQGALAIAFDDVKLDANRKMVSGVISPKRGKEKLNVSGLSASFGAAEECENYTEIQLDPRGFDDDGVHYLTGTRLDPYGFDQDGNFHPDGNYVQGGGSPWDANGFNADGVHQNGTPYDDNGCDRDGLNQYGQPCVWRTGGSNTSQAGGPTGQSTGAGGAGNDSYNPDITPSGSSEPGAQTIEGVAYGTELGDEGIRLLTARAVDSMLTRIDGQLAMDGVIQSAASSAISLYISVTGLDRAALVGPNDELLAAGMSRFYPNGFPPRDVEGRSLAYQGYDLALRGVYDLDKYTIDTLRPLRTEYTRHIQAPEVLTPVGVQLAGHVRDHINTLPAEQVTAFKADPAALFQFVRLRVAVKVFELFTNPSAGYTSWFNPGRERRFKAGVNRAMLADLGGTADIPLTEEELADNWQGYLRSLGVIDYDPLLGFELPIKIEKEIAGDRYAIYIDDINFNQTGAQIEAFAVLPRPGKDGEYIVFKGDNIPLTQGGIAGNTRLALYSKLDIGLGSYGTMTFKENSNTFIEFDCEGYKGFSLDGEILFCRDKVMPLNDDGTLKEDPLPNGDMPRVKMEFDITGQSWLNMTLDLNSQEKFAVKGLRQVWWQTSGVHIDFSEEVSDGTKVTFPEGYVHANANGRKPNPLWQGVYIKRLDATVDVFDKRPQGQEMRFLAEDLVIDNSGVTIKATGFGLLSLQQGKVGKWAISVDTAQFHMQQNTFVGAFVKGAVELPVNEDNQTIDTLRYVGQADATEGFLFSATLMNPRVFEFTALKSQMTLMPNTHLRIAKTDAGKYRIQTQLYGELKMGENNPDDKLKIPKIVFEDFRLASSKPFVDLGPTGRFGIQGAGVTLSGFSLEIRQLELFKADPLPNGMDQVGIDVAGALSLMAGSGGFAASGGVTVFTALDDTGPRLRLKYERLKVNDLFFNVKIPGVAIAGGVRFFEDNTPYGDGFQGMIDARFDGIGLGVSAAGMFGSTDDDAGEKYRYWFVDAAVQLPIGSTSIPLVGVLHCTGLGGGASYHMTRSDNGQEGPPNVDFTQIPSTMPPIGQGLSGLTFVPDKDVGIGLRIMTAVATFPTASVLNGALLLGAEFNSAEAGFGLNKMYFAGNAAFMAPTMPDGLPIAGTDPIFRLGFDIEYSHWNRSVSGGLYSWLNYFGLVEGAGGNQFGYDKFLGQIELKVSPTESYFWVGRPYRKGMANDPRFSVKLKPLGLTIGTYFDFGTKLPPPPTLPDLIDNARAGGGIPPAPSGFMHGTEISVSTGVLGSKTLGTWMEASAVAGYNVLITDALNCGGRTKFGVNNWYLVGNAYAAITGKGEILWFDFGPTTISAYGEVQAPNPSYIYGSFTYDDESFDFDFGTACSFVSDPPPATPPALNIPYENLITATRPSGERPLGLTEAVEVEFANRARESFFVPFGDQRREFRINYDTDDMTMHLGQQEVDTYVGNTATGVKINAPVGGWKPNEIYHLSAEAYLEEKRNNNWVRFSVNGQPYRTVVTGEVHTDDAPDFSLIKSVSPRDGAVNVDAGGDLKVVIDETDMRAFYDETTSQFWPVRGELTAVLTDVDGNAVTLEEDYSARGNFRTFTLRPDIFLRAMTDYTLSVTYRPLVRFGPVAPAPVYLTDEPLEESLTVTFKTGPRKTDFAHEDVDFAYPRLMQYNTYRDQRTGRSYVNLIQVPDALIGANWINPATQELVVRYIDNVNRDTVELTGVNLEGKQLWWEALPQTLGLDKTYELQISLAAKGSALAAGSTAPTIMTNEPVDADRPQPRSSGGYPNGHVVFTNHFRTSMWATFETKIDNIAWSETATFNRQGMMSPRYTRDTTELPEPAGNQPVLPYVNDSTLRSLGYGGYRDAVGLTEAFSQQELNDWQVAAEMDNTSYVETLRDDVFGYFRVNEQPGCASTGTPPFSMAIEDKLNENSIYLQQGIEGPVLTERTGHREGAAPLAGTPSTSIFSGESTPLKTVAQLKTGHRPGTEYANSAVVRAAPLVLVNNLHPYAVRQHNNSYLVRSGGGGATCDPPDFNGNVNDQDLQDQVDNFNNRVEDFMDLVDEVTDAIRLAEMLGSTVGGVDLGGGNGGIPTFGGLLGGGGDPQVGGGYLNPLVSSGVGNGGLVVTFSNNVTGGDLGLSMGGVTLYQTGNFGVNSNDLNTPRMNQATRDFPRNGNSDLSEVLKRWKAAFGIEQLIPAEVPSPLGQPVRVKLVYKVLDHTGTVEKYSSFPIDVTVD